MDNTATIYAWAGGREAFERWLNAFYDLVEDDEDLADPFGGEVDQAHRDHVVTWWCEVMGGAERGGSFPLPQLGADERLNFVTLLSHAADLVALPADPAFRAAIMGYAEWETRRAEHSPAPRWGWGVAAPVTG